MDDQRQGLSRFFPAWYPYTSESISLIVSGAILLWIGVSLLDFRAIQLLPAVYLVAGVGYLLAGGALFSSDMKRYNADKNDETYQGDWFTDLPEWGQQAMYGVAALAAGALILAVAIPVWRADGSFGGAVVFTVFGGLNVLSAVTQLGLAADAYLRARQE